MKTFRSFIKEETSLDTHIRYHEAGIPLPDRDDITEYPGGKHGYSTGPDTFAIHTILPEYAGKSQAVIDHFKSTSNGDIYHRNNGPAVEEFEDGKPRGVQYFKDGKNITSRYYKNK